MATTQPRVGENAGITTSHHELTGGVETENGPKIASTLYAGCFTAGTGDQHLVSTASWDDLNTKQALYVGAGMRMVSIDTREEDGAVRYVAAWRPMGGGSGLYRTADWSAFKNLFDSWAPSMALLDFDIQPGGGARWC